MIAKTVKSLLLPLLMVSLTLLLNNCSNSNNETATTNETTNEVVYPSDVIPFMDEFKIMLGDGTTTDSLIDYADEDFFYVANDGETDWVVYKTPNAGTTSENSSNTRTELRHQEDWIPETGGKLTGTLKVMHVSTSGDATGSSTYSTVVGQIHSGEGHENEPLKIFYKKFPGHTKGSVFWNYEINTAGDDNSGRWDNSTSVWGYDKSVVGSSPTDYPEEPEDGIELGEEFSYEINVHEGIMYLTFTSEGHDTVRFIKNLMQSEYTTKEDIPEQIDEDGVERENAYADELMYFKQGAYNQTNTYDGDGSDIAKQYEDGAYTEVWFKSATVGPGTPPDKE